MEPIIRNVQKLKKNDLKSCGIEIILPVVRRQNRRLDKLVLKLEKLGFYHTETDLQSTKISLRLI